MKHRRFTKQEKKENRERNMKNSMAGTGVYIFENNTDGDLSLPRPTASGQKKVGPRGRFQGDSYYMQWVKPPLNLLKFIDTVTVVDPALLNKPDNQQLVEANMTQQKKLILDQPDQIGHQGKIEHVVADGPPQQKLNDATDPNQKQPDVLLNEDPLDGVEIILG
jgi:hypothetical protein